MGVMTPTTHPGLTGHDTLNVVTSRGTDRRTVRVEPDLWNEFGVAAQDQPDGRSGVLREFIRWYLDKPGSELPQRGGGQGGEAESDE